jgi:diacylglycerol kinase family enzyme
VRCTLIYNPMSGRKRDRLGQLRSIVDALAVLGHQAELIATTAPGSATAQARDAMRDGADAVFACGGDGAIHEVIQALVSESGQATATLGIIPLGSANALARHLRLSLDPMAAALEQIHSAPQLISVGKVQFDGQARYFTVMAGAGPDGALVYDQFTAQKSELGRMAYYLRAARLFLTRRFRAFDVEYTEAASGHLVTRRAVSAMAVRVGDLGGLFSKLVARDAGIRDSHLQLVLVGPPAWLSLPLWFICGWMNLHGLNRFLHSKAVTRFSCRPLSDPPPHFQADGEWLGHIPIEVSLVPNALRILIPDEDRKP